MGFENQNQRSIRDGSRVSGPPRLIRVWSQSEGCKTRNGRRILITNAICVHAYVVLMCNPVPCCPMAVARIIIIIDQAFITTNTRFKQIVRRFSERFIWRKKNIYYYGCVYFLYDLKTAALSTRSNVRTLVVEHEKILTLAPS